MITARDWALMGRLAHGGVNLPVADCRTLRRAALTLHRWAELECGTDRGCIERDDDTGRPYWHACNLTGRDSRWPVADREAGALRRVAALCKARRLCWYHQTDPRGAALYILRRRDVPTEYHVTCLDEGRRVPATSRPFADRPWAVIYAATVAPSRRPRVESRRNVEAHYPRGLAIY